ncbi:MAG TPA: GntR family transcriptional regulator [Macromonas sp.]|nr:GntR family transcriptional regulator [Macromonas sp.]
MNTTSSPPLPTSANPDAQAPLGGVSTPAFSPLYQQIKTLILQSLQEGEWKPGDLIPSELELAARYRVSQGTVRKAIDELSAENLLVRRQGKGTFVATHNEKHIQYRFLRLQPDEGNRDSEGPAERRVLECRQLRGPSDIARALGLRTGEPVLEVKRVLSFQNVPTILEDIWLPGNAFKDLTLQTLAEHQGPMYALFETQFGVRMVRAEEKLKAVGADEATAERLGVPTGFPLLSVERIAYTYNDVPMEFRRGLYRTDLHHYRNTLS